MNEKATEVVGEWAQGGKTFALDVQTVRSLQGRCRWRFPRSWRESGQGKLQVNGGLELRLALKVEKGKDGVLKATLASPDQGANDIPVSSVGLERRRH